MLERMIEAVQRSYTDEIYRRIILFNVLNILLACAALVMTMINLVTMELELMGITGLFTLLCLANVVMIRRKWIPSDWVFSIFSVEAVTLLVYFVMGGIPDGFSVQWTLLVPALSIAVFGKKMGIRMSVLVLLMITFFFWTPLGRSWLYYEYHTTFMLRFPFVYISLFVTSLYVDTIRKGAYQRLKEMEEEAANLYRHDALTGVYTRYAFYEHLQQLFETPVQSRIGAVMVDLDDFKKINDAYGHNAGDQILRQVAGILSESVCEHCIVCRWGGEEFMILMRCQHDPYELAEKLRRILEKTDFAHDGQQIQLSISVGVAVADSLERSQLDSFINCADKAMYISKAQGKNQVTIRKFR